MPFIATCLHIQLNIYNETKRENIIKSKIKSVRKNNKNCNSLIFLHLVVKLKLCAQFFFLHTFQHVSCRYCSWCWKETHLKWKCEIVKFNWMAWKNVYIYFGKYIATCLRNWIRTPCKKSENLNKILQL